MSATGTNGLPQPDGSVGLRQPIRLHPWNVDFEWQLPATAPTTLTPAQKDGFDRDGFVVLPEVVAPAQVAEVAADLDDLEAEVEAFLAGVDGQRISIAEAGAITFTVHCVKRSAAARRLAHHPTLVGLCADLLGPDANLYWDQAVYKKPEKPRRFPWHQDNGYTFVRPQHYLTCWVALTDATLVNGCPQVLPGVHRGGTLLHRWVDPVGWECIDGDPAGVVVAEVPAGGVVAFSSLTPHLTGPNTTDEVRKAYILQYAPPSARVIEGDWQAGAEPTGSAPCDDPERQFPVLRDGRSLAV